MCFIYIGFEGVCSVQTCQQFIFEVSYRTNARDMADKGRFVSYNGNAVASCDCFNKLYLACISQYDENNPEYRLRCYDCRGLDNTGPEAPTILPSNTAQNDGFENSNGLKVRRPATILVESLMNDMIDRQRSTRRYHEDHEKIFLDTQHIMNLRLHKECDVFEGELEQALQSQDYERVDVLRDQIRDKAAELDAEVLPGIVERLRELDEAYGIELADARSATDASAATDAPMATGAWTDISGTISDFSRVGITGGDITDYESGTSGHQG